MTGLGFEARVQSGDVHGLDALKLCEVGVWDVLKFAMDAMVRVVVPDMVQTF